ncbi:MAG: hypothetical protein COX15_00335 [Candidatus Colwellbacteria bacterium CG23_combo_of_CG06-09_8_20_14_all_42_19]|uniref:Uncharacterized protein n=1 Tax=Candidatus Colwellbacteria bacterium CG23_combo_of_CG06-09_8_20_14_all_42_19 TaxID=1974541 RepID=A0A2H0AM90_9BACT|nr:MAG: hypothetical protein COX15_00335 [Candidatus Colwellbacteria bacterium CG23_combo_of_CG06-09_8_20_14_all_42_19]
MEKFFHSRIAQVISGVIVGFALGIALKNAILAFIGPKLFVVLTSGMGLFVVLTIVVFAIIVWSTIYARLTRGFQQGHNNQ